MEIFDYFVISACVIIMALTIWACMSDKVNDGLPVKVSLAVTNIMAYTATMHMNYHTLGMMVIAGGITAALMFFQRFVLCDRLMNHHSGEKICQNSFQSISRSPNLRKAQRRHG